MKMSLARMAMTRSDDNANNRIEGGAGNDILSGGIGADTLIGNGDDDWADYGWSGSSVQDREAWLRVLLVLVALRKTMHLGSIENIRGSLLMIRCAGERSG